MKGRHREQRSSEILDRPPPHSLEAEQGVLGSILLDPVMCREVAPLLRAEDFHDSRHGKLYTHLLEMCNGGGGVADPVLLTERLKEAGDLEAVGGKAHIAEIVQAVPVAAHAVYYARIVRDKAILRALIHSSTEILRDAYNGGGTSGLVARARAALDRADDAGGVEFRRYTCAELDSAEFDTEYLVDRTLVAGQPGLLAAAKKGLKTTIAIDLGISLATAEPFLGALKVNRACRVGLMSGESGMSVIQETARRIAASKGYVLGDVGGLVFSDQLPQIANLEHLDALSKFLAGDELEVLVIDPTYMAMSGEDAANLFKQGTLLRGVTEVCQEAGATLVLVHHMRKNITNPFQPPELEDIAWAGFQEWARQWLLLGRRERYESGTGEHHLWLNVGGSAGHSALWALDISEGVPPNRFWQLEVMRADEARQDAQDRQEKAKEAKRHEALERDQQRLCNAMAKYPDGETANVLKDAAGLRTERFRLVLAELLDTGEAVPCEVKKKNRAKPYPGYKLVEG